MCTYIWYKLVSCYKCLQSSDTNDGVSHAVMSYDEREISCESLVPQIFCLVLVEAEY